MADGAQLAGARQPLAAAGGDDAPGAQRGGAQDRHQPLWSGAEDDDVGARLQAGALDGIQGDGERVDHRRVGQGQPVGDAVHALHAGSHVVGVAAGGVVAVLAVADRLVAVVQAQVVAPGHAHAAVAAAAVRGGAHAVAGAPAEPGGDRSRLDHGARPLVAGHERVRLGPEAGKVAGDDVRIGAADVGGVDTHQHVVAADCGDGHLLDGEFVRSGQHQCLHAQSGFSVMATARIGEPAPFLIFSGRPMKVNSRRGMRCTLARFSMFRMPRARHIMCAGCTRRTATS